MWDGFGKDLEALGASGTASGHFSACLYLEWFSKVLLEASGLDFGSILKGLGRILGGFGIGFGRDFKRKARPAALDVDYGEPVDKVCKETSPGSKVFVREWTKATVKVNSSLDGVLHAAN